MGDHEAVGPDLQCEPPEQLHCTIVVYFVCTLHGVVDPGTARRASAESSASQRGAFAGARFRRTGDALALPRVPSFGKAASRYFLNILYVNILRLYGICAQSTGSFLLICSRSASRDGKHRKHNQPPSQSPARHTVNNILYISFWLVFYDTLPLPARFEA